MSSTDLEFGAFLPRWDRYAASDGWRRIATVAEDVGLDWVGRGDRIVFPESKYRSRPASELFSVLASVATMTEEIAIGTNVCVVPYRHPIHLVKEVFTLDTLTGGRFEFGVGAGWLEEEFDALDVPYEERGPRTDEFLEVYDAASEQGTVSFNGCHYSFDTVGFYPRPEQDGGPPLWAGGSASPTFRRAAKYGIGWTISGVSPEDVRDGRSRLLNAWNDYDRDCGPEIAVNVDGYVTNESTESEEPLVGTVDSVLNGINAYREAGATRINLTLSSTPDGDPMTIEERIEQIKRFDDEIFSKL